LGYYPNPLDPDPAVRAVAAAHIKAVVDAAGIPGKAAPLLQAPGEGAPYAMEAAKSPAVGAGLSIVVEMGFSIRLR
ncbi:MAG TPA: hypothetical protein PLL18_03730, partial [Flavobacteriales bacterium]|nr:hypothetical protein [Flavobacteriales bacterium]